MHRYVEGNINELSIESYSTELAALQATREGDAELTRKSFDCLMADLIYRGNNLGHNHRLALYELLAEMTGFALGISTGRKAYCLATGCGKTSAIIAWIATVHELDLKTISVSVSAFTVAALCEIKTSLIEHGVPETQIGIKFANATALKYQSTGNDDRRFQLVTHARVHGGYDNDLFIHHKGKARALMIYDESLIRADTGAIEKNRYMADVEALAQLVKGKQHEDSFRQLLSYLREAGRSIETSLEALTDKTNRQTIVVRFAALSDADLFRYLELIKMYPEFEAIRAFLKICHHNMRVSNTGQGNGGVVWYEISIPVELENILILDASYPVRRLVQLDSTIINGSSLSKLEIKRYDNVAIHHMKANSGRGTLEASFKNTRAEERSISREVIDVIHKTALDKAIIIFTFKKQGKLDIPDRLLSDMRAAGIDVDAALPQDSSNRRINILTWGQETSSNNFSHCEVVILAGVLYLPLLKLASMVVGQQDDIEGRADNSLIAEVQTGEQVHRIYQALSRGCCRVVDNGQAKAMDVYLIYKNPKLKSLLDQVMSGARWCTWESKFYKKEAATLQESISRKIELYLASVPEAITKVSTKAIKEAVLDVDADGAVLKCFDRALKQLTLEYISFWNKAGHSVVRVFIHAH